MNLPEPSPTYNQLHERIRNQELEQADEGNRKIARDVEIGGQKLILTSPDGTRWSVTVDNSGNLGTTSL